MIRIGTAGWSIPKDLAHHFPADGSHLTRYARRFNCVEINSSFYRPHAFTTYARWAAATPRNFRFAVKMPRTITHEHGLVQAMPLVDRFLAECGGLGTKRGPILVQLPPSMVFQRGVATRFFAALRRRLDGPVVCEPRHSTWFSRDADRLLSDQGVARVAADPVRATGGDVCGGCPRLSYFRLHGSPRIYWSRYSAEYLDALSRTIRAAGRRGDAWCIFDNTAAGAAVANARELQFLVGGGSGISPFASLTS